MLKRKIKIFNTPWHIAHQYELYKLPNTEWYQIVNSVRKWGIYRPFPKNAIEVPHYEKGKYDLAVLHVDQQCVDESIGKSRLYRELNEVITDIPKIVINHATPFWPEVYTEDFLRTKMKMLIGDNHMVCNSHEALKMWGEMGASAQTIIHGLNTDEWYDKPKEPRVFTTLSPAGLDRYYNRKLLLSVKQKLKEKGIAHVWVSVDWVADDFEDYRNFISTGLLYFNPTLQSPMPRARSEAMLSGACCITTGNHGAEEYIEHGKNGFLVPNNPVTVTNLISELIQNNFYNKCIEIGQRGKETAKKLFALERYQKDWEDLIIKVLGDKY